jgi:nicotinamide-nucleotide amidase
MIALPGPPRELQPMVERELVPLLQKRFGLRRLGSSLTLRFVGLGQSQISQTMQEHVKLPTDLIITSQFDAGRVDFTFTLPGQTEAEKEWLAALADTLRRELGENLYAEDSSTLEEQTVRAFARRGLTLALAEVGSGGHITGSLAQVQNLDQVLVGSYVAPTEGGLRHLLQLGTATASEADPLAELARLVRLRSRSDVAVVVGFPEPEEGRPRKVRVLWADPNPREAQFPWSDASAASNALLTTRILDWLRRQLAKDATGD